MTAKKARFLKEIFPLSKQQFSVLTFRLRRERMISRLQAESIPTNYHKHRKCDKVFWHVFRSLITLICYSDITLSLQLSEDWNNTHYDSWQVVRNLMSQGAMALQSRERERDQSAGRCFAGHDSESKAAASLSHQLPNVQASSRLLPVAGSNSQPQQIVRSIYNTSRQG